MNLDDFLGESAIAEPDAQNELENTLTKQASDGDTSMNEQGSALAARILAGMTKQANNVADETAQMVAEDDKRTEDTPVQGTVTDTAKAIANKAPAQAEEEQVEDNANSTQGAMSKQATLNALVEQGVDFDEAVEMIKQASEAAASEMEKAASIVAAVEAGASFDEATAGAVDYSDMEKAAAVATLVEEDGHTVEEAIALINEVSGA